MLYMVYRLALAVYADYWIVETGIRMEKSRHNNSNSSCGTFVVYSFPVYLTNWTYFMLCVYLNLHAVFALLHYCFKFRMSQCLSRPHAEGHRTLFNELSTTPSFWDEDRTSDDGDPIIALYTLPWYFKLTYLTYSIASAASILVTFMFFTFLWPLKCMHTPHGIEMVNLQLHGINSVIVCMDLLIHSIPIRLLHAVYLIIYGIVYLIFTAVFYGAGNKSPIYPNLLDWADPGKTIGMGLAVAFVGAPAIYLFMYFVHFIKLKIYHNVTPWSTL